MIVRSVDDLRQQLVSACTLYGYEHVETDLVDDAELFLTSASDSIVPRFYMFEQRGRTCILRPEYTTAAMKRYLLSPRNHPTRWQFFGDVFERDLLNHYPRRSLSFGIELIDEDGLSADLEVISLAAQIAQLLTGKEQPIQLSHVGFVRAALSTLDLDPFVIQLLTAQRSHLAKLINDLSANTSASYDVEVAENVLSALLESTQYNQTMGGRDQGDIAARLMRKHSRHKKTEAIQRAVSMLDEWSKSAICADDLSNLDAYAGDNLDAQQYLGYLADLCQWLIRSGIKPSMISIQLSSAKSWQYYTGVIFSVGDPAAPLVSGGRYNDLSLMMGSERVVPAVGFSCRLDSFVAQPPDFRPVQVKAVSQDEYWRIARILRERQIPVIPYNNGPSAFVLEQQADNAYRLEETLFDDLAACIDYLKRSS